MFSSEAETNAAKNSNYSFGSSEQLILRRTRRYKVVYTFGIKFKASDFRSFFCGLRMGRDTLKWVDIGHVKS